MFPFYESINLILIPLSLLYWITTHFKKKDKKKQKHSQKNV
jgi:hypothetical protein